MLNPDRLARALLRDRERTPNSASKIVDCFLCGASYTHKGPNGDDNGRFCSTRCREAYDAGATRPEPFDPYKVTTSKKVAGGNPGYLVCTPTRRSKDGWSMTCAGCSHEFESTGLRCCSNECEQTHRQRRENAALMAEVGMEVPSKSKCVECGRDIPSWRNGRRVPKGTRFCSRACGQKAARKVAKAAR